jgi:hypothetical protein
MKTLETYKALIGYFLMSLIFVVGSAVGVISTLLLIGTIAK